MVAFENTGDGIRVDAVLLEESQVANVFSYTRSYYFTDPTSVVGAVQFLHSILPRKPIDELYTVLGRLRQARPSASGPFPTTWAEAATPSCTPRATPAW